MQFQLEQSQWLPAETLRQQQFLELEKLLQHVCSTVPFYMKKRDSYECVMHGSITDMNWQNVPILSREDVQAAGQELHSKQVPQDHGKVFELKTSGSTGRPTCALGTDITQLMWNAFTLRDHLWHRRDLRKKLASIRTTVKEGIHKSWGRLPALSMKPARALL